MSQPPPSTEGRITEILEPLGERAEGGRVFRGRVTGSAGFSKLVAVKVLDDGSQRGEPAQRLRDEARLLALLRHRAIVHVEDLVEIDGRWAVVMELIDGVDLGRLIKRGAVPGRALAEIGVEIASALAEAHEARDPASGAPLNLVHRDVQPGNVLVTPQGQVKLLGFGLARARFTGREARTGFLSVGAAGYLAPERLVGVDSAAGDLYGLGATLLGAALGEGVRALAPTRSAHAAGVSELRGRLATAIGGSAGAGLADVIASTLAYGAEDRPSARAVEGQLLDLIASLDGPWLRRWAADRVTPYAPPPPPPEVPETEAAPPAMPPPSKPPATSPPAASPPAAPAPTEAREPKMILFYALLGGFGVALVMGLIAVAGVLLLLQR